jgi:hypothetical protein
LRVLGAKNRTEPDLKTLVVVGIVVVVVVVVTVEEEM